MPSTTMANSSIIKALFILSLFSPLSVNSQSLPIPTAAAKGTTQNLSIQNGSKSSLAFGTNTSFGASLSTQSSPGMTTVIDSTFVPSSASISSSIGSTVGSPGITKAVISNLKAEGAGTIPTGNGGSMTASTSNFASGNALLEGVGAKIDIDLASPGGSRFSAIATPNTVGYTPANSCNINSGSCLYTYESGKKPYEDQQFANGNATANITSNTTVDIQTNQFSSTFAQSF